MAIIHRCVSFPLNLFRLFHSSGAIRNNCNLVTTPLTYFVQHSNTKFHSQPLLLLLLLLSLLHWRCYRDYWFATTNVEPRNSSGYPGSPTEHIFILQSLLFPKGNKATLATLFAASRTQNFSSLSIYCTHHRGRRGFVSGVESFPLHYTATAPRQAKVIAVGQAVCPLGILVALCEFSEEELLLPPEVWENKKNLIEGNVGGGEFALEIRSPEQKEWRNAMEWKVNADADADVRPLYPGVVAAAMQLIKHPSSNHRGGTAIPLVVMPADTTPRHMVVCISRMVYYENWRMVVTALEVYRRLGVDLVVAYVLSVISPLVALMRHYEQAGFVRVKPLRAFPLVRLGAGPDDVYDANGDTGLTLQVTSGNECLYDYKASADFIALIDWDDLLVTGGNFFTCGEQEPGCKETIQHRPATLPDAFHAALQSHPAAAFFQVDRLQATSPTLFKSGDPYDFVTTLESMPTTYKSVHAKIVVVPSRLHGVWPQDAINLPIPNHTYVDLLHSEALIVHIDGRVLDELKAYEPRYIWRTDVCDMHYRRYLKVLEDERKPSGCLGFHQCGIPPLPGVRCMNAKSHYRRHVTGVKALPIAHVHLATKLEESSQGCLPGPA